MPDKPRERYVFKTPAEVYRPKIDGASQTITEVRSTGTGSSPPALGSVVRDYAKTVVKEVVKGATSFGTGFTVGYTIGKSGGHIDHVPDDPWTTTTKGPWSNSTDNRNTTDKPSAWKSGYRSFN